MKSLNIFKKTKVKNTQSNITKMDKNQLSKIVGGTETNGREIKVETPASGSNKEIKVETAASSGSY